MSFINQIMFSLISALCGTPVSEKIWQAVDGVTCLMSPNNYFFLTFSSILGISSTSKQTHKLRQEKYFLINLLLGNYTTQRP